MGYFLPAINVMAAPRKLKLIFFHPGTYGVKEEVALRSFLHEEVQAVTVLAVKEDVLPCVFSQG
jgi:hypothetical protein